MPESEYESDEWMGEMAAQAIREWAAMIDHQIMTDGRRLDNARVSNTEYWLNRGTRIEWETNNG